MGMTRPLIRQAKSLASFTPTNLQSHLSNHPVLPLHLPSLTSAWPALTNWKLENGLQRLREKIGEGRVAEIELGKKGRSYLHKEWQQIHMPFGLFSTLGCVDDSDDDCRPISRCFHIQSYTIFVSCRTTNSISRPI